MKRFSGVLGGVSVVLGGVFVVLESVLVVVGGAWVVECILERRMCLHCYNMWPKWLSVHPEMV